MPLITAEGKTFEVESGKRLILALRDNDIDILHRCGGYARCTTCRIKIVAGEPASMTEAEKTRLKEDPYNLYGIVRLSCQILCENDMEVEPQVTMANSNVDSRGKRPEDDITPEPVWTTKD